jgi:hypothetical protein
MSDALEEEIQLLRDSLSGTVRLTGLEPHFSVP